jgi:hypothetical protein
MEECTGLERTGLREDVFAVSVCSVSDIDKLRKAYFTVLIFFSIEECYQTNFQNVPHLAAGVIISRNIMAMTTLFIKTT